MLAGQLVEYGRRREVFESPMHPYTKAMLASYLTLDGAIVQPMPYVGDTPNLIDPLKGCRFCERCPQAEHTCRQETPSYTEITPTHRVLCHQCE
jgi:oligopeptide/dipeptide ABC transporter ATP-binding protein